MSYISLASQIWRREFVAASGAVRLVFVRISASASSEVMRLAVRSETLITSAKASSVKAGVPEIQLRALRMFSRAGRWASVAASHLSSSTSRSAVWAVMAFVAAIIAMAWILTG